MHDVFKPHHWFERACFLFENGQLRELEMLCREILSQDKQAADAYYLLGLALQSTAPHEALQALKRALTLNPQQADYHRQLGHSYRRLDQWQEALLHYQKAVELEPQILSHWLNLIRGLRITRQNERANQIVAQALQIHHDPSLLEIALDLAVLSSNWEQASRLLTQNPELQARPRCLISQGYCQIHSGQFAEAQVSFETALKHLPETWEAWNGLADTALCRFDWEKALHCFEKAFRLRHGPAWNQASASSKPAPLPPKISPTKLAHDHAQLLYLQTQGLLPAQARPLLEAFQNTAKMGAENRKLLEVLNPCWDAPIYINTPQLKSPYLNPNHDYEALEFEFLKSSGWINWDSFLTEAALEALRKCCLESTFWRDYYAEEGYLGAFMDDGFANRLLFGIAQELTEAMPKIFKNLPLRYLWAFKYHSESKGIRLHADQAQINLNFWLTPDSANLDPTGGGLLFYDKKPPENWGFQAYNDQSSQGLIEYWLKESQAQEQKIAHRQNRAVLFQSKFFHRSDPLNFKPGYENQRINVTMLFGS
ncbi:hypothetical protein COW36_08005 [bacterium (Candidatus Blackallbacteria) CG17_big_fil_post_rev_8_21_14_2_50_48_46]|uniref:Tetratricopeptide repeat protein n=1 Tax=bacterium (Candidatus Blackallbacteria) CG17_big_fil_post_rev_8_21_14_2_50_48_46 TaxID=2014261 RepID=A0A2M7G610_9BACT|nr:MAG: hypothetical protein COW64_24545 [bacterium (Candidatus Blackallbacteria) CG18_big_fil_WC_8_21_14_2_50_49_26]PIW17432.1 MAG: hypothetical protein COW36_08005 [bacterium (Candidatus Blackallbacteria) CG17_big_fil_post_rev_8_21_14_2_50_48_46]PIW48286.1 MAG: hypothetical protein COW20_09360 [bacterium (Candidatus Blackallbacteria) CG13_big_fil_rev_8_21_14_2_50_49_14]